MAIPPNASWRMLLVEFIDGVECEEGAGSVLGSLPLGPELQSCFPAQNLTGGRLQLSELMLAKLEVDLECVTGVFQSARLKEHGWEIKRQYLVDNNFTARVGGRAGRYEIQMSLGVPLIALSTALEISWLEAVNPYSHTNWNSQRGMTYDALERFFPEVLKLDEVGPESMELALDVCLLLHFHEVSHAVFGHCDYKAKNSDESRSLEFDADFNAGSMFASWLPELSSDERRSDDDEEIMARLVKASLLLGAILKAKSGRSMKYHLPQNRMRAFLGGGVHVLTRTGKFPEYEDVKAADMFWDEKINSCSESMRNALARSSLKNHLGAEQDVAQDEAEMMTTTHTVRTSLKDGPLSKLSFGHAANLDF